MDRTNSSLGSTGQHNCTNPYMDENYIVEKQFFGVTAIVLNTVSCPLIVFMNVLVIVAVKTRRRLQNNYHILLACLAGTDLLAGAVVQPCFIAREILRLSGALAQPVTRFSFHDITTILIRIVCFASLFHLALLSVERYIALKHSLRYITLVTTSRLTFAVVLSWIAAIFPPISVRIPEKLAIVPGFWLNFLSATFSLLVIAYCHITVYFESRRHMIRIQTEQMSQEAAAKFKEDGKAWKTTFILIGCVLLWYLPGFLFGVLKPSSCHKNYAETVLLLSKPLVMSCFLLNSLWNPVIYCWRSKEFRKAFRELLTL